MPPLLRTRRFLPLFITQFLGAFNDNVFKNALVMLITYKVAASGSMSPQILVTLAAGLFILPFFLFSATAGQLADKYDRAFITRIIKIVEIVLMVIAAFGFYFHAPYFLLFVLFCMGAHSTFFGPIKYALLPQHLQENELIAGNAYIEAGTFLAILLGTILGGLLILSEAGSHLISIGIISFSVLGYIASRHIPVAPGPVPDLVIKWNLVKETWEIVQYGRQNRRVWLSILGISWFWLIGATFLSQLPTYTRQVLAADETVVTLFLTLFSVGVGAGSLLCNRLLRGLITSRYAAWAAAGISLFTIDLYFASATSVFVPGAAMLLGAGDFLSHVAGWRIAFDLFAVAVCAGIYIVPLYALMQHLSDPAYRARIIACNNILNALFMVLSAIGTIAMLNMQFSVPQVFLAVAMINVLAAVIISRLRAPS